MVCDLGWQMSFFADPDGLADRIFDAIRFVSHVGLVEAAHCAHHFRDLDHFFCVGVIAGDIEQTRWIDLLRHRALPAGQAPSSCPVPPAWISD